MIRRLCILATCLVALALVATNGVLAAPQDKGQDKGQGKGQDKSLGHNEQKAKGHKNLGGKDLVGDKIKRNGSHKIREDGKISAYANVSKGKIAGINVKHSEKGSVAVTKYKTDKKMAMGPGAPSDARLVSFDYAQDMYVTTIWIGYGYIDDYGYEIIFWFPFDMILDGDTGAIEFYPA